MHAEIPARSSRRLGAVWGVLALGLTVCLGWAAFHRAELVQVLQAHRCSSGCPELSDDQLREEVVRSYLHLMLDGIVERRQSGGNDQLVLLPAEMSAQSLERDIRDSTLLDTLTRGALQLSTHEQIEQLDARMWRSHPTLAAYSLARRNALVVPLTMIQPAPMTALPSDAQQSRPAEPFSFSLWEQLRGYGRHFFRVTEYPGLSLACCDGRGEQNGLSPDWLDRNSLRNLQSSRSQLLAVTNRGAILLRQGDDGAYYLF